MNIQDERKYHMRINKPVFLIESKTGGQNSAVPKEQVTKLNNPTIIELFGLKSIDNEETVIGRKNKQTIHTIKEEA